MTSDPRIEPKPLNSGWSAFARGIRPALRKRCPQCGAGRLFASRFKLCHACEACGLVFRREVGAQTGSMYLCAAITEIFAALLCVGLFLVTDWGPWVSIAVALPLVVLFSFWFLPLSMAAWVAVEYASDVGNDEEWVDASLQQRSRRS